MYINGNTQTIYRETLMLTKQTAGTTVGYQAYIYANLTMFGTLSASDLGQTNNTGIVYMVCKSNFRYWVVNKSTGNFLKFH